jgi:eukaryotic-like serine/threonine-protein kinase
MPMILLLELMFLTAALSLLVTLVFFRLPWPPAWVKPWVAWQRAWPAGKRHYGPRVDQAAERALLLHFSQRLLSESDGQAVAGTAVTTAATLLDAEFAALFIRDAEGDLALLAVHGWPAALAGELQAQAGAPSLAAYTMQQGWPLALTGYSDEMPVTVPPAIRQMGIAAGLAVPLAGAAGVSGALLLHSCRPRYFGDAEVHLLWSLANLTAAAREKARLYAESRRRAAELAVLVRVGEALNQVQETAEVLQLTLQEALHLAACEKGCIILLNPHSQTLYIEAQVGLTPEHVERFNSRHFRPVDGTFAFAMGRGELLEVPDTATDPRVLQEPSCPPPRQLTQIPLKTTQGVIGVIELNCLPTNERTRSLLRALAVLAAAAIEKARLIGELHQLAITDEVTGLHNRRHFLELAARDIGRAQRYGRSLAVILFDIDNFKQFNDTYGHATGDEILRAVAARCRQTLRDVDLLARYGGEELVVLLPESTVEEAYRVAERLRRTVAEPAIYTRCGPLNVTISLGVAALTADCTDIATLLDRADAAMYRAKQAGRNQIAL